MLHLVGTIRLFIFVPSSPIDNSFWRWSTLMFVLYNSCRAVVALTS